MVGATGGQTAIVTPADSAIAARPSVERLGTSNVDARGAFPDSVAGKRPESAFWVRGCAFRFLCAVYDRHMSVPEVT
jgi:hypothetical protein